MSGASIEPSRSPRCRVIPYANAHAAQDSYHVRQDACISPQPPPLLIPSWRMSQRSKPPRFRHLEGGAQAPANRGRFWGGIPLVSRDDLAPPFVPWLLLVFGHATPFPTCHRHFPFHPSGLLTRLFGHSRSLSIQLLACDRPSLSVAPLAFRTCTWNMYM